MGHVEVEMWWAWEMLRLQTDGRTAMVGCHNANTLVKSRLPEQRRTLGWCFTPASCWRFRTGTKLLLQVDETLDRKIILGEGPREKDEGTRGKGEGTREKIDTIVCFFFCSGRLGRCWSGGTEVSHSLLEAPMGISPL